MRKRCNSNCLGTPEPGYATQTFEKRGSLIKVTIHDIPADVCPLCHTVYVKLETGHEIDRQLESFQGHHDFIPVLPPAEVAINFVAATAALRKSA